MGKSVPHKPPTFEECEHCHREFGSKSLELHLLHCSERVPNSEDSEVEPIMQPMKRLSLHEEVETSHSDDLSSSWPNRRQTQKKVRRKRRESLRRMEQRPKTAVLTHPVILDETLKDKIDMTLTKKQFLAALKLCNEAVSSQRPLPVMRKKWAPVGYRRDNQGLRRTRLRPCPLGEFRKNPEGIYGSPSAEPHRPKTSIVDKRFMEPVDLPNIQIPNPALKVKSRLKARNSKKIDKPTEKVPEPCRSCGRSDLPERFHTHPPLEASKSEGSKIPIRMASPPKRVTCLEDHQREDDARTKAKKAIKKARSPARKFPKVLSPDVLRTKSSSDSEACGSLTKQKSLDRGSPDDSETTVSTSSNVSNGSSGMAVSKSITVTCSVCGKPFMKNSIKFHEPQCHKKQQALKEKQERDLLEEKKNNSYYIEPESDDNLYDETFVAIWEAHVQQLIACSKCSRTFFPDRIEIHERNCKATSPLKASSMLSVRTSPIKSLPNPEGSQAHPKKEVPSPSKDKLEPILDDEN